MHLEVSSEKCRPFCPGLNVLKDMGKINSYPTTTKHKTVYKQSAYLLGRNDQFFFFSYLYFILLFSYNILASAFTLYTEN